MAQTPAKFVCDGRTIDYTRPPNPPLEEEDAAWARKMLKERAGTAAG